MYRHIPIDAQPVSARRGLRTRTALYWIFVTAFVVALGCVVPLGFLLVLPFMIGFLSKVKSPAVQVREQRQQFDPDRPYDNL